MGRIPRIRRIARRSVLRRRIRQGERTKRRYHKIKITKITRIIRIR